MGENEHPNAFRVVVADGKYDLRYDGQGGLTCLRHGEPWPVRDASLVGDKFVFCLAFELDEARKDNAALRHALEPFGSLVIRDGAHVDMPITTLRNAKGHPATIDDVDTAATLLQSEAPGQWLLDQWTSLQGFLRKQQENGKRDREEAAESIRELQAQYIERDETVQDLANLIGWHYLERCPAHLSDRKLCDRYKRKGVSCPWHDASGFPLSRIVDRPMGKEIEELVAKLANPTTILWMPEGPGIYWCNLTNGHPSGWHPVEIRNMGGLNDRLIVLIPGDEIHHDLDTFAHRVVCWGEKLQVPDGSWTPERI